MNIIEGDTKITGNLLLGNATNPPQHSAGSGAMTTTNKPDGTMHFRTDANTLPEVLHNSAVAKMGLSGKAHEILVGTITANAATTTRRFMHRKGIITGVRIYFLVKPSSALGTVVIGITVGGNAILASASEDLEGLTDATLTALNLTATTANLKVATGDAIVVTITSNNADMTGGTNCIVLIDYDDN